MKICFITSSFPRFREDVSAPWLLRTAKELAKKGNEISIFVPSFKGLKQTHYESIRIYRFRYFLSSFETLTHEESSANKLHRFSYKILVIFYILSGCINSFLYFLRNKFDVIDVHWPFPQILFGVIGKFLTGAKLISHFYASEILLIQKHNFIKYLFNFLLLFVDHIITISSFTNNVITKELKYKIPVNIIPFGPNIEPKTKEEIAHKQISEKVNLLFVGRLIERKGVIYLLKAVKILTEWKVPVILTIIGEGYHKKILEAFIKKNKIEDTIIMKGTLPLSSEELALEYDKSNIFIFPSIFDSRGDTEGLGCVLIEALMFKKPVIASNVGGICDVIKDNETGFLVPEKEPMAIAKKIVFIKDNYNYALKVAENGYNYVLKNFSWDSIISKLLNVYKMEHKR